MSGYTLDHRILHKKLVILHELWNQDALSKIEVSNITITIVAVTTLRLIKVIINLTKVPHLTSLV